MEFANDPGPYPITTIRDKKWIALISGLTEIDVKGVHGCELRHERVRVVKVDPYEGPLPHYLTLIYKSGGPFIAITLDRLHLTR